MSEYIIEGIQKNLEGVDEERQKVADITFSFNNKSIIKLLKKRSKMLNKREFDKASLIEKEMNKLKVCEYDELIVPNNFLMTFMHVETKRAALEKPEFKFENGQSLSIR